MFEGFATLDADVGEVRIHARVGGSGPPVLLLHGFPETHAMWDRMAARLALDRTVVAADLRGYGDSTAPDDDAPDAYSFRAMALDQVRLMRQLGHERFAVVGHDRGARVTHRLALDHPEAVERVALLDILPTRHVYEHVDKALATAYYHWFFLIQPEPVPERLMAGDPIGYLHSLLGGWGSGLEAFAADAMAEYERCFADPATRHAMAQDYRAAAGIDLDHDEADAGRRIQVPAMVLWGESGIVSRDDPLRVWADCASDLQGHSVAAGHFLVEEAPTAVGELLAGFLTS